MLRPSCTYNDKSKGLIGEGREEESNFSNSSVSWFERNDWSELCCSLISLQSLRAVDSDTLAGIVNAARS